eukprot:XP_001690976.1 hypothetical protein CHLREDRAFT_188583 [Chlamydomonas reinhardtii]
MALASAPGMPDLQLRMSKKIAQLTKVIYHLNNKNEDNELDLAELAEQYETEIEQILKDTADKINHFKAQLDAANDAARIAELTKQLEAKYDDERRRCLTEIENIRKRAAEKEQAIQKAASKQIEGLQTQVDELQRQLQARIKEVNELSNNANASGAELQGALARARAETEEAIQTHNKKYNDMLAERMRAEDALSEQLDAARRALEAEQRARADVEAQFGDARTRWDQERVAMTEERKASDASWKGKVEALVEEDLEGRLAGVEGQLRDKSGEADRTDERLTGALKKAEGELADTRAQLAAAKTEIEGLNGQLAKTRVDGDAVAGQLRSRIAALEEEVKRAIAMGQSDAVDAATKMRDAYEKKLADAAEAARKALESAQRERDDLIEAAKKDAAMRLAGAEGSAKSQMEDLRKKWDQLEARLKSLTASESSMKAEEDKRAAAALMSSELSRVEREGAAKAESQLRQAKQEADARLVAELSQLRSQLSAAGGAAEASLRQQLDELRRKMEGDMDAMRKTHAQARDAALAAAAKSHEDAVAALTKQHEAALAAAQAERDKLDKVQAALGKKAAGLEEEKAALAARVEQLQEALAKKAAEMADTVFRLKQDAATERDQLLRSYTADKEVLQAESAQLAAQLRQQLADAREGAAQQYAELEANYSELKARWDAREPREEDVRRIAELEGFVRQLEELVRTSEERMAQLRAELLLREDNYNKHFKNGGAGEKVLNVDMAMNAQSGVVDWMLGNKKKPGAGTAGDGGAGKGASMGRDSGSGRNHCDPLEFEKPTFRKPVPASSPPHSNARPFAGHCQSLQHRVSERSQSSSSAAPAAEALEAGNANGGASASSGCALSTAELKVLLSAAQRLFQPCPRCFNAAGGTRNAHTCFLDLNQITVSAVLRAADAAALYDIGGVQQFSINGHKVVFLHARPQKSKPGAVSECGHCHRSLMDAGSRHCSLECKLNWQQRAPPLTQEQLIQHPHCLIRYHSGPPSAAGAYGGQIPRSQGAGAAAAGGATASGCTEDKRGLEQGEAEPPPQSQPRRWREDAGTVGAAANSAQLLLQGGTSCTTSSGGRVAVPLATNAVLRTEHVDLARFLLDQLRARGISCGMPPPSITAVPLPAAEGGMGGGISSGATAAGAAAVNRRRMSASDVAPVASAAAVGARPAAAGSDARSGTARHGGGMGLKRRSASMDLGEVFRQQPNFSVTAAAGAASGGYGCGYGGGSATAVNDDFSEVTSPHRFGGRGQRPAGPQAAHGAGRGVIGAAGSAPAAAAEADALAAHMALLSPSRLQRPLLPWERRVPAAAAGGLGEAAAGGSDGHMTAGSLTAAVAAWSRSRRGSGDLFGTWVGTSLPGGLPSQPAGAQMEPAVTTSSNDDGEQATGPRRVKARKGQPHQAALA